MAVVLHADQLNLSREVGANLRAAAEEGYLTDAGVVAADTVTGVRDLITNAAAHADQLPNKHRFQRAIDFGAASGELNDADINPLTTVDGLVGLTQAANTKDRNQMLQ
jgi:hypothetical protein